MAQNIQSQAQCILNPQTTDFCAGESFDLSSLESSISTNNGSFEYSIKNDFLYVPNSNDGTVSVIDANTNSVVNTINVGNNPRGVSVSPDGNFVYVANQFDDTVSVIDANSNSVVNNIGAGDGPLGVSVSPDGNFVYVTNYFGATVSIIDANNNSVVNTINVGILPLSFGNFYAQVPIVLASPESYIPSEEDVVCVLFTDEATGCTATTTITFENEIVTDASFNCPVNPPKCGGLIELMPVSDNGVWSGTAAAFISNNQLNVSEMNTNIVYSLIYTISSALCESSETECSFMVTNDCVANGGRF